MSLTVVTRWPDAHVWPQDYRLVDPEAHQNTAYDDIVAVVYRTEVDPQILSRATQALAGRDAVVVVPAAHGGHQVVARGWARLWLGELATPPAAVLLREYVAAELAPTTKVWADDTAMVRALSDTEFLVRRLEMSELPAQPRTWIDNARLALAEAGVRAGHAHATGRDTIHECARWYAKKRGKGDITKCPMHRARQAADAHRKNS